MRNRERLKRLRHLHYMLKNYDTLFPKVHFSINRWRGNYDCGTVACALGTATMYAPFRALGLKYLARIGHILCKELPAKERDSNYDTGAAFFGITYAESLKIFHPDSYRANSVTPKHVAEKVKRLIARYEKK